MNAVATIGLVTDARKNSESLLIGRPPSGKRLAPDCAL